jgi:hypothetical protein
MNGRRQLLGAVGLGSLLAGVTAVVPGEGFAATAKPRPPRNSARNTRFSPSLLATALRMHLTRSRAKASSTPARRSVTAIPSSFSSNGYPPNRSWPSTRRHDAVSTMFCGMRCGGRVGFRDRAQARHEAVARLGEAGSDRSDRKNIASPRRATRRPFIAAGR